MKLDFTNNLNINCFEIETKTVEVLSIFYENYARFVDFKFEKVLE